MTPVLAVVGALAAALLGAAAPEPLDVAPRGIGVLAGIYIGTWWGFERPKVMTAHHTR